MWKLHQLLSQPHHLMADTPGGVQSAIRVSQMLANAPSLNALGRILMSNFVARNPWFCATILTMALAILNITKVVNIPLIWVLSPLWIMLVVTTLMLVLLGLVAFVLITQDKH